MNRSEGGAMQRRDLLLTLSEELSDLGASAASLQSTLGRLLDGTAGAGNEGLWQLQEIDRLQQTLEDLSAILRGVAEHDGHGVDVDGLLAVTRLGALRKRLHGSAGEARDGQKAGIVALF